MLKRPTCVSVICVHMIYSNQLGFSGGETMKYKINVGEMVGDSTLSQRLLLICQFFVFSLYCINLIKSNYLVIKWKTDQICFTHTLSLIFSHSLLGSRSVANNHICYLIEIYDSLLFVFSLLLYPSLPLYVYGTYNILGVGKGMANTQMASYLLNSIRENYFKL